LRSVDVAELTANLDAMGVVIRPVEEADKSLFSKVPPALKSMCTLCVTPFPPLPLEHTLHFDSTTERAGAS